MEQHVKGYQIHFNANGQVVGCSEQLKSFKKVPISGELQNLVENFIKRIFFNKKTAEESNFKPDSV